MNMQLCGIFHPGAVAAQEAAAAQAQHTCQDAMQKALQDIQRARNQLMQEIHQTDTSQKQTN